MGTGRRVSSRKAGLPDLRHHRIFGLLEHDRVLVLLAAGERPVEAGVIADRIGHQNVAGIVNDELGRQVIGADAILRGQDKAERIGSAGLRCVAEAHADEVLALRIDRETCRRREAVDRNRIVDPVDLDRAGAGLTAKRKENRRTLRPPGRIAVPEQVDIADRPRHRLGPARCDGGAAGARLQFDGRRRGPRRIGKRTGRTFACHSQMPPRALFNAST